MDISSRIVKLALSVVLNSSKKKRPNISHFLDNWYWVSDFIENLDDETSKKIAVWYFATRLATEMSDIDREVVFGSFPGIHSPRAYKEAWERAERMIKNKETVSKLTPEVVETNIFGGYIIDKHCEPKEGDIVLDVGSFNGNNAIQFSKMVGKTGIVYTFEPIPDQFEVVKKNCLGYENIIPVNIALGASDEVVSFDVKGSSSRSKSADLSDEYSIEVKQITIDGFIKDNDITRVHFLKMDIEGAEIEALRGATELLKAQRPVCMIAAYHRAYDLYEFPRLIDPFNLWYQFKLRHYHHRPKETVLYGIPQVQEIPSMFRCEP